MRQNAPPASERGTRSREAALAARWAAGEWRGQTLRTERGECYQLIFQGRRGGGAGPDFRDAVLAQADGARLRGDIELHLRASDWQAHGHASDPRYNDVVLHVVLATASPDTRLANGVLAPVVVLRSPELATGIHSAGWPCANLPARLGLTATRALLVAAGYDRFASRVEAFMRELAASETEDARPPGVRWGPADRALFVALAEALGYGRDRATLHHAGERLARGDSLAALLAEAEGWQRVERLRLDGLAALYERWRERGPWLELRTALMTDAAPRAAARALLARLRVSGGGVSPGRAMILAANVALPFAAAYAAVAGESALAARAQAAYAALPGLPSNQITREMARQLGLPRLPSGAAAQLGLHHIWATWCRDKRCGACLCNQSEATEHTEITEDSGEGGESSNPLCSC
jgi:hypothetical protein